MHLLIDWGNSRLKYILVERLSSQCILSNQTTIQFVDSVAGFSQQLQQNDQLKSIDKVLISSVKSDQDNTSLQYMLNQLQLPSIFAQPESPKAGVKLAYKEPNKIGADRWLAMIGAFNQKQPIGIMDLGTAITIDLLNSEGLHLGGHIIPGQKMRINSLLTTDKVRVDSSESLECGTSDGENRQKELSKRVFELKMGDSTQSCVDHGIEQLISSYFIQIISSAHREFAVSDWKITGGDSFKWVEHLSRVKFDQFSPRFILSPKLIFQGLSKLYQ